MARHPTFRHHPKHPSTANQPSIPIFFTKEDFQQIHAILPPIETFERTIGELDGHEKSQTSNADP